MPTFERDQRSIYYEEHGEGFPILAFAPGGVRSSIAFWERSPWNPIRELASSYRVIVLDQRNAGRSRAPIAASDGWHVYTDDHLALLDHLGVERAHLLGGCIGGSFILSFLKRAPSRVASAVLQQPIGRSDENVPLFRAAFDTWASELSVAHPEASASDLASFRENLFGGEFTFSATRDDVRAVEVPLLVLMGNDAHHPSETSREIVRLARRAELVERWKEPEVVADTVRRVRAFLEAHTPR